MAFVVDPIQVAITDAERLLSIDESTDGGVVALVDSGEGCVVRFGSGAEARVPTDRPALIVTSCGPDLAVVVAPRTAGLAHNAWVLSPDGVMGRFSVGDAVGDVIAVANGRIAVTYFDEGCGRPLSGELVAVFDLDGNLRKGYTTTTGVTQFECCAAVKVGAASIGFWPYPDWRLTVWNTVDGTEQRYIVPGTVRGAHAITHKGDRWWFYSPYGRRNAIFEWRLGSSKVTKVGSVRGPLRGTIGGRFLTFGESGPAVIRMD